MDQGRRRGAPTSKTTVTPLERTDKTDKSRAATFIAPGSAPFALAHTNFGTGSSARGRTRRRETGDGGRTGRRVAQVGRGGGVRGLGRPCGGVVGDGSRLIPRGSAGGPRRAWGRNRANWRAILEHIDKEVER